ncbi:MAG: hypothetical protein HC897_18830 [Thermoanaerobaculia bacterium]|nr:hypothetical protein [Thermoanaerobaculia bacterium]
MRDAANELVGLLSIQRPYDGTANQRTILRMMTSALIKRYVDGIRLCVPGTKESRTVEIQQMLKDEIRILKELTWHYVITNPALAMQQYGKARIIRELFRVYTEVIEDKDRKWLDILPRRCQELVVEAEASTSVPRLVADAVSSLADGEAVAVYRKLAGLQPGSVLDLIPG